VISSDEIKPRQRRRFLIDPTAMAPETGDSGNKCPACVLS
jgi:hypothetical protein